VGEYHEFGEPNNPILLPASFADVPGHPFTMNELKTVLENQGFSVDSVSDRYSPARGTFFAKRK
jgi:hypothetical protein